MRLRFFVIILCIFLITVTGFGLAEYLLVRKETIRLLDQQIEAMISAVYSSQLSFRQIEDMEEARRAVHKALGDDRLNMLISLYTADGKPIYQSHNAAMAALRLRVLSGRELIETKRGHLLRVVTVPLAGGKQYLQAGVVLDDLFMRWRWLGVRLALYSILVFVAVAMISYGLSGLLLRPLESLGTYLQHRIDHLDNPEALHATWSLPFIRWRSRDEVGRLIEKVQSLLEKVRETVEINRARAALLAHEVKTPLTVMKNRLELLAQSAGEKTSLVQEAMDEVDHLGRLVTAFTQWSLFCSDPSASPSIHAIKLSSLTEQTVRKLECVYPNRLNFCVEKEGTVFADPEHLTTVVNNILTNALKYSAESSPVEVTVGEQFFSVRDYGAGFPKRVLERLGSPFNVGNSSLKQRGTGLGLAWVSAISKKYGWKVEIRNIEPGSLVTIRIPLSEEATGLTET